MRKKTEMRMKKVLSFTKGGLSVAEACKKVGMSPGHFYQLRKTTEGKAVKASNRKVVEWGDRSQKWQEKKALDGQKVTEFTVEWLAKSGRVISIVCRDSQAVIELMEEFR